MTWPKWICRYCKAINIQHVCHNCGRTVESQDFNHEQVFVTRETYQTLEARHKNLLDALKKYSHEKNHGFTAREAIEADRKAGGDDFR